MIYAAAAMMMAACTNDSDVNAPAEVALQVNATISGTATRLGISGEKFAEGAAVSVFADGESTPKTYTADADGNLSATAGYLLNDDKLTTFTACYPVLSAAGEAIAVNTATSGRSSQSSAEPTDDSQAATAQTDDLDILFAKGKASRALPEMALKFSHVMSKLTFSLTAGDGISASDLGKATLKLSGLVTDGTFSTTTGEVKAGTTKGTINPAVSGASAEAIIVPQAEATILLTLTIGGMDYTKRFTLAPEAGNNYAYPVTVNANGFSLGTVSIKPWNDVEDDEDVRMEYVAPQENEAETAN
jgi:hypothetical protein